MKVIQKNRKLDEELDVIDVLLYIRDTEGEEYILIPHHSRQGSDMLRGDIILYQHPSFIYQKDMPCCWGSMGNLERHEYKLFEPNTNAAAIVLLTK